MKGKASTLGAVSKMAKRKFLIPVFTILGMGLWMVSCDNDDGESMMEGVSEEVSEEMEPEDPAPEWGPTITDSMLTVIEEFQSFNVPPLQTLTPEEARQQPGPPAAVMGVVEKYGLQLPASKIDTSCVFIPVEGGEIHGRVYTPDTGKESYPVIVYFHGGGWVIAGVDAYNASAEALAQKTDAVVVSVAYRQAPEFKFPTAHDDAYAAYLWILENADTIKGDSTQIAVAGESAGGNLAGSVSLMAKRNNDPLPVHQALVYPIADYNFSTPSYQEYQNSLFLNSPLMEWFFGHYLNEPSEGDDPRVSLVDADLGGMPPTTIIGAEIDPLQSEGAQLAQNLEEAGVPVTYELYIGVVHEFFGMASVLPEAEQAQDLVVSELREAFEN